MPAVSRIRWVFALVVVLGLALANSSLGANQWRMRLRAGLAPPPSTVGDQTWPPDYESGAVTLEDFETTPFRSYNSGTLYWFRHEENSASGDGTFGPSTANPAFGTRHYRVTTTPVVATDNADAYEVWVAYTPSGAGIRNLKDVLISGTWSTNNVNRFRIWVKVPSSYPAPGTWNGGFQDVNIGMYLRHPDWNDSAQQEIGGGHFYSFYFIPYTGVWHQVVFDYHPTHTRNCQNLPIGTCWNPSLDLWNAAYGNGDYWTETPIYDDANANSWPSSTGVHWMDAWSTFYFAGDWPNQSGHTSGGGVFDFDQFEFYRDTNDVVGNRLADIVNIRQLNGAYRASDHYLYVGWARRTGATTGAYDVKYAFQSIYTLGWANATAVPGCTGISPESTSDAVLMRCENTNGISMGSNNIIYIGIQKQGQSLFNQIAIPVTGATTQ